MADGEEGRVSKYSPAQLRAMAEQALQAKQAGDHRYLMLVINLSERTGLSAKECEQRILALAFEVPA